MSKKEYNVDYEYINTLYDAMVSQNEPAFEKDICYLENLLYRHDHNFERNVYGASLEDLLRDDLDFFSMYSKYYPYVRRHLKSTSIFYDRKDVCYRKKKISDSDAVDIARSFFTLQGDFFSDALDNFFFDDEDQLEFIKPNDNTEGEMVFIASTYDAFVFVPDYEDIRKVTILIHELEHVIDSFSNPNFYSNLLIREVASLFMEMIGSDYVSKELNLGNDNYVRRYQQSYFILTNASFLYEKNQFLHLASELIDTFPNKDLIKLLNNNGFSEDYLKYLTSSNITEDYYYQIAYLIAVELYMIYKQDKKYALLILKNIIMNGNNYNIFDILGRFNIHLNSSTGEYEKELYLGLK